MPREVYYIRDDGARVRGIATLDIRHGPLGRWMVGDTPLSDVREITRAEWLKGEG